MEIGTSRPRPHNPATVPRQNIRLRLLRPVAVAKSFVSPVNLLERLLVTGFSGPGGELITLLNHGYVYDLLEEG